jgi:DNA-binding transcriptional ArsR family regulator
VSRHLIAMPGYKATPDELSRVLSHSSRLQMIDVLAENGPMSVTALADAAGLPMRNMTSHLRPMVSAGLLVAKPRRGSLNNFYDVTPLALQIKAWGLPK